MKKNILIVIPKFVLAGAETMCKNLILKINKKKINLIVVSLYNYNSSITKELEDNGIKVIFLNKRKGFDISIIFKLRKIIKSNNIEVVHTHLHVLEYAVFSIIFMNKRKIQIVHTVHHLPNKDPISVQMFHKYVYNNLNVIPIAISEQIKKDIVITNKIDERKVVVINNGIDLNKYETKKDYSIFSKIVHIGRFVDVKNHKLLIDVFEKFIKETSNCVLNLYLIGDGPLYEEIVEYISIQNNNDNIHLLGTITNCCDILKDYDLFILPSKYEGMPMTIIEAMATGLPIIASNVGGIPDMIDNGINGYIANDEADYVKYIKELYNNKVLREKIGKNAIKKSKNFSSEKMAKEYEKIYFKEEIL